MCRFSKNILETIFMRWKIFTAVFFSGLVFIQTQAQNQSGRRNNTYYEEMIGNLSNQLRLLQDENAKLSGTVYTLQREMRELKQQMQNLREENAQVRQMVKEESDARQKQMGNIADRIQNAADAQNRANAEAERARAEAAARRAQAEKNAQDEYDYYVVEAGATLTTVSRATGISIARLKQVNGLKNDTIWVGQKLKIPRK